MANALNLELRDGIDPSGNNETSVQVVYVDPESGAEVTSGLFLITNGLSTRRIHTYRRAGDAGSANHFLQDVNGQMIDAKAVG